MHGFVCFSSFLPPHSIQFTLLLLPTFHSPNISTHQITRASSKTLRIVYVCINFYSFLSFSRFLVIHSIQFTLLLPTFHPPNISTHQVTNASSKTAYCTCLYSFLTFSFIFSLPCYTFSTVYSPPPPPPPHIPSTGHFYTHQITFPSALPWPLHDSGFREQIPSTNPCTRKLLLLTLTLVDTLPISLTDMQVLHNSITGSFITLTCSKTQDREIS